jgi:ABC-type uncharacterized transport system fused permease/ATPase subunit
MASGMAGPERERLLRWLEESPTIFAAVRRLLHENDQAVAAAGAAQAERAQLQQQYGALRENYRQLFTELARLEKERADFAQWFTAMMLEAAARFPSTIDNARL